MIKVNFPKDAVRVKVKSETRPLSFAERGLARRNEGKEYLPNPNGKQAVARRLRQLQRLAEKHAKKGPVGGLDPTTKAPQTPEDQGNYDTRRG